MNNSQINEGTTGHIIFDEIMKMIIDANIPDEMVFSIGVSIICGSLEIKENDYEEFSKAFTPILKRFSKKSGPISIKIHE